LLLIVSGQRQTQLDHTVARERFNRQEVTSIHFGAIRSKGIDLICSVRQPDETVRPASSAEASYDDDVSPLDLPFALRSRIEPFCEGVSTPSL